VILITTSRRPTNRIRTLCNELTRCLPNSVRVNRGKLSLEGVAEKSVEIGADSVLIIDRWKGGPGKIKLFKIDEKLTAFPPVMYVRGVKLQREFGKFKPRRFSSLAITTSGNGDDSEIKSLTKALAQFFAFPLIPIEEVASKNLSGCMLISRDSSQRIRLTFLTLPNLLEVGPRLTLSKLAWRTED